MPTPTTLVQFWQQERDVYDTQATRAQATLTAGQAALAQAIKDLADEQLAFSTLADGISAKRKKLAETTIPADAAALLLEIRDLMIQLRISQGKIQDFAEATDAAKADVDVTAAAIACATAHRTEAEARLDSARDGDRIRQAAKNTLAAAPLSTLAAVANTAGSGPEQTAADAKVVAIPGDLRAVAGLRNRLRSKRLADARGLVTAAENAYNKESNDQGGLAGAATKLGGLFRRAERALLDFVATGKPDYDRAIALFRRVGGVPVLSAAEQAQATAFNGAGAGTTAKGNAVTVIGDQTDIDADRKNLEATILTKQLADIDADAGVNADVITARGKVQQDLLKLADDVTNHYADKSTLDQWQAIVPDPAWQKLLDFQEATAILTTIANTPATLAADMDNAEKA